MGKRTSSENNQITPIKRRKRSSKTQQAKAAAEENNTSSSDDNATTPINNQHHRRGAINNVSCDDSAAAGRDGRRDVIDKLLNNSSFTDNSPKPEFVLSRELVNGTILTDVKHNQWRTGNPIGKGSFGEIFLASDDITKPVTSGNAKYVVKIEPHSNGPLFVEIHCLLNTAKNTEEDPLPPGMPEFIAFGSHVFRNTRYRFLILQRFDRDLHSLIKRRRVDQKSVLTLAVQIIDILQHIHDKGYCHSDIKAENLMIGRCTYNKLENEHTGEEEDEEELDEEEEEENSTRNGAAGNSKRKSRGEEDNNYELDEEDESEEEEGSEAYGISEDIYKTPLNKRTRIVVPFSGSNPVRSCRVQNRTNTMYEEMVMSHYLRPTKRVSYSEYFDDTRGVGVSDEETLDQYISRSAKKAPTGDVMEDRITEDRIILIDFGLASKFMDSNGVHRPFFMDQRRAHDGTLEFTSRDAHLGAHSRRSDLECLGYNLIFWSQGYLPWKDNAAQLQHEKVHWMKEYFMTDVKEMLKHIYGKSVPKYLGEFMNYVGQLAYHDRPDYEKCKNIFKREFKKLGLDLSEMVLNVADIIQNSVRSKDEIENNNTCEMKNIKSIMKNLGVIMPFRESNTSNRVSPKNLRSKSDCRNPNTKKKKFSWTEILSQDPDQIARERAEKEFDREPTTETPLIRYTGKPTYAILEIENRLKFKDRLDTADGGEPTDEDDIHIQGYTKAMMKLLRKRQVTLLADVAENNRKRNEKNMPNGKLQKSPSKTNRNSNVRRPRTKSGLRQVITPTQRALDYNETTTKQKQRRMCRRELIKSNSGSEFSPTDESSCSSVNSVDLSSQNMINNKSKKPTAQRPNGKISRATTRSATASTCSMSSGVSDEDSRDVSVSSPVFSPKKTRHTVGKLKLKIVKNAVNGNLNVSAVCDDDNDFDEEGVEVEGGDHQVVGARRRKRSIPKKRNNSTKVLKTMKQTVRGRRRGSKQLRGGGPSVTPDFNDSVIVIQDDNYDSINNDSDNSSIVVGGGGDSSHDEDSSDFDFIPDDGSDYDIDSRTTRRVKKRICRG